MSGLKTIILSHIVFDKYNFDSKEQYRVVEVLDQRGSPGLGIVINPDDRENGTFILASHHEVQKGEFVHFVRSVEG